MCANLIILVAALIMAFSKTAKSFEMILVGRFLYGIGTGMCSGHCGVQASRLSQGCLYRYCCSWRMTYKANILRT